MHSLGTIGFGTVVYSGHFDATLFSNCKWIWEGRKAYVRDLEDYLKTTSCNRQGIKSRPHPRTVRGVRWYLLRGAL